MSYVVKGPEVASVELSGWRDKASMLWIGDGNNVARFGKKSRKNWPKTVKLRGRNFALESVVVGKIVSACKEPHHGLPLNGGLHTFETATYA